MGGVIDSQKEGDEICVQVERELVALQDPHSGYRPVSSVVRTEVQYPGPKSGAFADLLAIWDKSHDVSAVRSPRFGEIRSTFGPTRVGNHRAGGWFVSYLDSTSSALSGGRGGSGGTAQRDLARSVSLTDFSQAFAALTTR